MIRPKFYVLISLCYIYFVLIVYIRDTRIEFFSVKMVLSIEISLYKTCIAKRKDTNFPEIQNKKSLVKPSPRKRHPHIRLCFGKRYAGFRGGDFSGMKL